MIDDSGGRPGLGTQVELYEAIRRDFRLEGLSIRALAERHGVHRRTVRAALASAVPAPRKVPVRVAPKLEAAKPLIDAMLVEDLTAWRKQQHTARRVLARLVDEHGMSELTYSAVRDYVAKRRPEVRAAAGHGAEKAFVPQTHEPGAEAEVDFGDVWLHLDGELTKCALFTLRLSYSGKAIHRIYASQGQEAFIEGHLEAFRVLGGTPVVQIRYDNLKSAVTRVLFGHNRTESDRWVSFRSHHGFDKVLTEREETNSVAIASNESFSGWTKTFTDPRLGAAIVDRITFGGNIIETGTTSYRLAHARAQQAARS